MGTGVDKNSVGATNRGCSDNLYWQIITKLNY